MKTRHFHVRAITVAACLAALGGCASWTPPVTVSEKPSTQDAYLYGRFGMTAGKAFLGLDGYSSIGFKFQCLDGASYTVRFRLENDVQLLRVKPATCSLQETIFTNADGQILGKKPSPVGIMKGLKLEPGTSYYIGDFHGSQQITAGYTVHQEWRIDSAYDRYATTTEALKALYPAFSGLPTLDVMTPTSH